MKMSDFNNGPLLMGITGSIGMGKTTVINLIKKLNIPTWSSDDAVHELYKKGNQGYAIIEKLFPDAAENNCINRTMLSNEILKNPSILKIIEKEIHPLVTKNRITFLKKNQNERLISFDIPLLFETSCDKWLNLVIVVTAPFHIQKKRVLARESMTDSKFNYILSQQISDHEKKKKADFIVDTNVGLDSVSIRIKNIINTVLKND